MKLTNYLLAFVVTISIFSCDDDTEIIRVPVVETETITETIIADSTAFALKNSNFVLQLLHYADVDSNEDRALQNVDDFGSLIRIFKNDATYGENSLIVTSGDIIIPGPRYFAAENNDLRALTGSNEPGHVDILFANSFGVMASAVGNHELDQGPGEFADAISSESRGDITFPGAEFPFLASNLDFSAESDFIIGVDGSEVAEIAGNMAKYAVKTIGGQEIGIVGVSTPTLPTITSTGGVTILGGPSNEDIAAEVQKSIDALTGSGVNKIVVLAHMQSIAVEKALASLLRGADIIVAGGSNTRMGDENDILYQGDASFNENYPFVANDANGDRVLVVNVDGDYKYLGRLVVGFDAEGKIIDETLTSLLNGAYATSSNNLNVALDQLNEILLAQSNNVVGQSDVFLDGRRSQVRTQETNLGNLTADSMLWYANLLNPDGDAEVKVALKNGGGIRTEVGRVVTPAGSTDPSEITFEAPENVTEGDLRAVLRFNNGLTRVTLTAAQLKDILEHGFSATGEGETPGRFPQVAGITVSFDASQSARTTFGNGARVIELKVGADEVVSGGVIQGDANRTFNVVTLNFLANGGDGYPYEDYRAEDGARYNRINYFYGSGFGDPEDFPDAKLSADPGKENTISNTGGEQDAFAEYMLEFYSTTPYNEAETPVSEDTRIIQL